MGDKIKELQAKFDGHGMIGGLPCTRFKVPDGTPVNGMYTGFEMKYGENGPYTVYAYRDRVLTVAGIMPSEDMVVSLHFPDDLLAMRR